MPYIKPQDRAAIDPWLRPLLARITDKTTPGDLAYILFTLMYEYWRADPSFTRWAGMRGAIEDQLDEFRGRFIVGYEAVKRQDNGDVV